MSSIISDDRMIYGRYNLYLNKMLSRQKPCRGNPVNSALGIRRMSELKSESNVTSYFVTKGALAVLDSVSVILAKVAGLSEKERLDTIVSCSIPYLKFQSEDGNATSPIAFLSKYLGGSGDAETIDLYQLLAKDKGVRRSVHSQIKTFLSQELFFKDTGIDLSRSGRLSTAKSLGVSNAENAYRQKLTSLQCRELFIDIPQSDFQVKSPPAKPGAYYD